MVTYGYNKMDSLEISNEISVNECPRASIAINLQAQVRINNFKTAESFPSVRVSAREEGVSLHPSGTKGKLSDPYDVVDTIEDQQDSPYILYKSYKSILLNDLDCEGLLKKLMSESSSLRMSDAVKQDFSFRSCFSRLMKGYSVFHFNYKTAMPEKAHLSADGYGICVKQPYTLEKRFSYQSFSGLLIGAISSTFKKYLVSGKGNLNSIGLDNTDCFSMLNNIRSLDFATHSDTAKYDIWIVFLGYTCALSPNMSSCIPLSKQHLTLAKVKDKLRRMAMERDVCVKELFLMAIAKCLIQKKESKRKIMAIKDLLNKSFSPGTKMFRLITMNRPSNYRPSRLFLENIMEGERIIKLGRRMGFQMFESDKDRIKLLGDWTGVKNSLAIYQISTLKKYLNERKREISID